MKAVRIVEAASGVLAGLAGGIAIAYLLIVPAYATESCQVSAPGVPATCTRGTASLLQVNGATAIVDLGIFAALLLGVAVAAVWHGRTGERGGRTVLWVCTAALAIFTVLGILSIGGPFLPSVALALVASVSALGRRRARPA
jgi:hypothetical protein